MEPRDYYIKGDEIGRGAYKIVYKAIDRRKGIEVAWNELDLHKDIEQRKLIQEIEILGNIDNEYIIRFYEYWISDLKIIFITELMTSGSLRSFLHTAKFVSIGAVKNWCRQILSGLDYLHRICDPPIIHRDIKLDNIFFHGATGQVKIGDLGLATVLSQRNSPMSVIGTPEFMAPEFYNDTYDEKVDIWAFGLCVIEMTTLQYPYSECTNVGSVYRAVYSGLKPQALAKIKDQKIIEFVCSCLEEDVNKRLSSSALLSHPFLTETESDGQYIALCNDEEIHQATLIIGLPPTKQGWELWIQKIVVPIRESRQRSKNNSLQHASPVPDVILDYEPTPSQSSIDTNDQVVDTIEYQPRSSNKVFNNTFKKEEEDHDEIIEDFPTPIPTKQIPTNIKTDSPRITPPVALQNIDRVDSGNNSSRLGTPHTTANTVQFSTPPPKEEGSNTRWHNQITKNLQELHLSHRETPNTISSQSLPSTLHTTAMSSPASNQTNLANLSQSTNTFNS